MSGVTDLANDGFGMATWSWGGTLPNSWGFYPPNESDPSNFGVEVSGSTFAADLTGVTQGPFVVRGKNGTNTAFETGDSNVVNFPSP